MRADRLIAALMLLQAKGQITARELADELEISTRTARRDLEALAMSGVPLYSQAGRGGGWRLIGGATTDLTGLSSDESRALFMALGPQAEANPILDAALRKLVVAVPEGFRSDAVAATSSIKVDATGWGQIGPTRQPAFVAELSEAVIAGRQVSLSYTTPGAELSERIVHPLGLVTKRGVWYLVANTAKGMRTFRVSRVSGAELLDLPVERPVDFDLTETWESIVTRVEAKRVGLVVDAYVAPSSMRPFGYVFSNRFEVLGERVDGWVHVRISETTPDSLGAQIAGFGGAVDVVHPPPEVAAVMRRITGELIDAWL